MLQLICPTGLYGAERWILALANHLDPGEVASDLAVTDEGGGQNLAIAEMYPRAAGEVHRLTMRHRFDPTVVARLARLIRAKGIDIVHSHGYKSDILGVLAAKRAGVASLATPHGFDDAMGLKLRAYTALGTTALRFFDAVAPLSEDLCHRVRACGVAEERIRMVRNGVDLRELDAYRWAGPRHDGPWTIGYVGQLIPRKNVAGLIRAFDAMWRTHRAARLRIVGDGAERGALQGLAQSLPSRAAIEFLGYRTDRLKLMAEFDLFAMTSSMEGIPRCLMEAMSIGVPVVAYAIPGVDTLVAHGGTGLLVDFDDEPALASSMARLLDEPDLARTLSANARARIERDFSGERMAREYTALYQELCAHRAGR